MDNRFPYDVREQEDMFEVNLTLLVTPYMYEVLNQRITGAESQ